MRGVRVSGALLIMVVVATVSGCGDRPEDLATVTSRPLASPNLLGMEIKHEVESPGTPMEDASVWRQYESSDLTGRRLLDAIRQVGLDAGWTSWSCDKNGRTWLLRMRDGNPGLWAHIQVDGRVADVEVGKDRPGSHSGPSDFASEDAFSCS